MAAGIGKAALQTRAGQRLERYFSQSVAGADSIADLDALRHGGMGRIFGGIRAPSTGGTFLRTFAFGHVLQLGAVSRRLLAALAGHGPLLPGADQVQLR